MRSRHAEGLKTAAKAGPNDHQCVVGVTVVEHVGQFGDQL